MGTNYYLRLPACTQCGHAPAALHIGKSSAGWNFGLRIYPKIGETSDECLMAFGAEAILELEDWLPLFARYPIFDEYGERVDPTDMRAIIAERTHPRGHLLSRLSAGPEYMGLRHDPTYTPTYGGKGTYDLCHYEFS